MMIAAHRARPVTIRPGRRAYVVIDKYRCDRGDRRVARALLLGLPKATPAHRLSLRIPRGYILGYCGRGDPGSTLTVSTVVPTLRAALR
jgi:hypothetical protein